MLKDAVGSKIGEKFGFSDDKVGGIIETISSTVGSGSALTSLVKGGDDSKNELGGNIVSALTSKSGLTGDIAGSIKDMVLPLILKAVTGKSGGVIGNLLSKFKF